MKNLTPAVADTKTFPDEKSYPNVRTRLKTLASLFKLRIVLLLLISALGGASLGAGGWPGGQALVLLVVTGGLSAAGASAINQYLERDRDAQMKRTRKRPLPAGAVNKPVWVLWVGSGMVIFAIALSAIFNPALAISNALGAVIYIGVYTIWLKPRTILNIVIGGAAGSMAVISGGAASHAWNEPGVLALALLIFVWTPTHFWSLAMAYRHDYARADFPMLPVKISMQKAAWWVAVHTLATGFIAVLLALHPSLGIIYFIPVGLLSLQYLFLTVRLIRIPEEKLALSLFKYSNIYLGIVQLFIIFLPLFRLPL